MRYSLRSVTGSIPEGRTAVRRWRRRRSSVAAVV